MEAQTYRRKPIMVRAVRLARQRAEHISSHNRWIVGNPGDWWVERDGALPEVLSHQQFERQYEPEGAADGDGVGR